MTIDPFEIASAGDENGGADSWLVTYADAIILLMAFFVVMFSISKPDSEKLDQVSGGLAQALHKKGDCALTDPVARQGSRAAGRPG
jgi:chemotaxis protein MotB